MKQPEGSTYKMVIINTKTGETCGSWDGIAGGFFIIHREGDGITDTDQGIFGAVYGIAIAAAKTPAMLKELLQESSLESEVETLLKRTNWPRSL